MAASRLSPDRASAFNRGVRAPSLKSARKRDVATTCGHGQNVTLRPRRVLWLVW
jgi:hypothetical protein